MTERLTALAKKYGVALHYQDAHGKTVSAHLPVVAMVLQKMGVLADCREERDASENETVLPPVLVVPSHNGTLTVALLKTPQQQKFAWTLSLESGEVQHGVADSICRSSRGGRITSSFVLPCIPFGYHNLELPGLKASTSLIVTPDRCYVPESIVEAQQTWGISLQLYLLRSARNWGIGDFGDLARLAQLAAGWGCDVLGLKLLHQMFLDKPEHASPYSPASRRFLSALYIDVEAVSEFEASEARELVAPHKFKTALEQCRATSQVDYTTVTRLKLEALRLVFDRFQSHAGDVRKREFAAFVEEGGDALQSSSLFQALRNHFSRFDPVQDAWERWQQPFRSPTSAETIGFRHEHQKEIQCFSWLQWVADQQLSAANVAAAAAGMKIGLYRGLAVGCDRSGCETWSQPSAFLHATQVGLNPSGQKWGLPPLNPVALQIQAYKPFIDPVRTNMRHAGGLRIDHVMRLQRLYCIPEGSAASEGAYISYPIDDLIGILALESHRNRCFVVGEDLGTVPAGFREKMTAANIFSYRVLFFEQDEDDSFISPDKYPALAVAVAGCHDLPTLRGWLIEADIDLKQRRGYPSDDQVALQRSLRSAERSAVLRALDVPNPTAGQFSTAAHRFLGRTRSLLAMARLDDLRGERQPVNVPATSTEHPNWRRKYSLMSDELFENQAAGKLIDAFWFRRLRNGATDGNNA